MKTKLGPLSASVVTVIILAIILGQALPFSPFSVNAAKTIIVPDQYATIGEAIANASPGDTIVVKRGIYRENPVVTKPLTLQGEDAESTVVIGEGGSADASVFIVASDNVKISGFAIRSLQYKTGSDHASGIIVGGDHCTIVGNSIDFVNKGIYVGGWGDLCGGKSFTTISGNTLTGCFGDAIRLFGGYANTISGNTIISSNASAISITGYSNSVVENRLESNRRGVGLGSSNTVVFKNNITGCTDWGMYFQTSNNVIVANNFVANRIGIYLSPSFAPNNNTFLHNNFLNNSKQVDTGAAYNVQAWNSNYWSNYTGSDLKSGQDGIGDIPHLLDAGNLDRLPLMNPFNISGVGEPPAASSPRTIEADHTAALWHFDNVEPNGVTPDAAGNNPAVLGTATGNITCPPQPVYAEGKYGKALLFDIPEYVYATASPSLDITGEITIEAWIKPTALQNCMYNNIVVQGARTLSKYQERVYGLAVNGQDPENATSGPPGAVCGYVYTDSGYNEIVTLEPAVTLDAWNYVVFTRSLTSGMHIYVNGQEKPVKVTSGVQNPSGSIKRGTELNIGHDYIGVIDELRLSDVALEPQASPTSAPRSQAANSSLPWWLWIELSLGVAGLAAAAYLLTRSLSKSRHA
ncbi:MAG: right-handed parallel beta-helix repeat-containing protein [Candidatus Bathyarchaeia archaeon]